MLKKIFTLALVSLCMTAVGGEKYSVLVFGDTHYDSQDVRVETKLTRNKKLELARNLEIWKTNMPLLIKAAAEKGNASADFAVQLGDLTQGDCGARELQEKSFRNVLEIFQKELKIPFYTIKGNHDIRGKGAHAAFDAVMLPYMSQVLKQPIPENRKANFAVMHKGDLYIYFDCMKPDVNFVYKAFEKYPDARYTFLLTHIPVLPAHNAAGLVPDEAERPEFLKVLAKRKAIVLCAHVHITTMIRCEMEEGDIVQFVSYSLPRDLYQEYTVIEGSIFDLHRKLDKPDKLAPLKPFFEARLKDFVYHRYGGGFNMLNISDEGVFCDLYTGDMKVPFKTIKLR